MISYYFDNHHVIRTKPSFARKGMKTPDFMVVGASESLHGDELLLIIEVKTRRADAGKAATQISAYLEAAAKIGLGTSKLRGMLIMHSKFSIFKLKDGKAVLVKRDLKMCSSECEKFLVSVGNRTVESTGY